MPVPPSSCKSRQTIVSIAAPKSQEYCYLSKQKESPVKRKLLFLTFLLFVPAGCDQAPNDDPDYPRTSGGTDGREGHQVNRSRGHAVASPQRYELQGLLGAARSFSSKEQCERARQVTTDAQIKADTQRSEHGAPLPNRPMLTCLPAL